MQITLLQGLGLGLVGFICKLDQQTEAFYWFRPIVVSFLAGLVLGDPALGVACGAVSELAYLGMTFVGGTVPPDPLLAGMMTVVIAYTTGQNAETALGLSYPFALLAQMLGIMINTAMVFVAHKLDDCAERADADAFMRWTFAPWFVVSALWFVLVFLCSYALQVPIQNFVATFPEWVSHGFEVAGNILPAVGLAMLMLTTLKLDTAPYLMIGFVMATFLVLPNVLPVAIVGVALAFINYLHEKKMDGIAATAASSTYLEGGDEDGI
jgi:PTS system galactosamine-specific IIC component